MSYFAISHARKLAGSRFARNVAIVATGTAGAQVITMAFSPIITRVYGPEAFGVLGTFTAILAMLTPLAALSYPIAIVLPKRDADAVGLAKLSIGIALAMSILTLLVLILCKTSIVTAFHLQTVESFILLLPLAMLFSAAMTVLSQWVIRKNQFKIKAKVAVLQSLWLNGAKVGIGLLAPVAAVLVVLAALGSGLHAVMLWIGVRNSLDGGLQRFRRPHDGFETGKTLAWRHRDFAYYRTPQNVLNAVSRSMPILMLASFFGPATAGFYSIGKMILAMPTTLIGQSVASVFYPRISEAVNQGEDAHKLLKKATAGLAAVGLVPFVLVVVTGPWLFTYAFGSGWNTAGIYVQWLAVWSYFAFINKPSVSAIPVLSLQGLFLVYEVISIALRAGALFLGFLVYGSPLVVIAIFSVVSAVLNASLICTILVAARRHTLVKI